MVLSRMRALSENTEWDIWRDYTRWRFRVEQAAILRSDNYANFDCREINGRRRRPLLATRFSKPRCRRPDVPSAFGRPCIMHQTCNYCGLRADLFLSVLRTSFSSLLILWTRTIDRIVLSTMNLRSYRICNTLDTAKMPFKFSLLVETRKTRRNEKKRKETGWWYLRINNTCRSIPTTSSLLSPRLLSYLTLTFARDTSDLSSSATLLLFRDLVLPGGALSTTQTSWFFVDTSSSKFHLNYLRWIWRGVKEREKDNRGSEGIFLEEWTCERLDAKISSSETRRSIFVKKGSLRRRVRKY